MHRALLLSLVVSLTPGCGGEPPPEESPRASAGSEAPVVEAAATEASEPVSEAAIAPEVEAPPAPSEPVNLLRAVATDLAVSSAYRDQIRQARRLVDGSLETAWNSRSGDLVGAWIEVRLPADVEVTGVALTAGFTHTTDRADLFPGNHRVARVRILHDGEDLGEHALDIESRELQTLPVTGGGGVYRVEVLETQAGSNRRWRELCVSELQVLGRAPTATPGQRYPRFGRGELPEPRIAPGSTPRAEVASRFRSGVQRISAAWDEYERTHRRYQAESDMGDSVDEYAWSDLELRRKQIVRSAAELVALVDGGASDRLRFAAESAGGPSDLDLVAEGFVAMAGWLGEDEARCRWARRHALLRLRRVNSAVGANADGASRAADMGEGTDGRANVLTRASATLREIASIWESNSRGAVRRLRRFRLPAHSEAADEDYAVLEAQLTVMESTCWP